MTSTFAKSLTRLASRCIRRGYLIDGAHGHPQPSHGVLSQWNCPAFTTSPRSANYEKPLNKREMIRHLRDEIRLETESQHVKTGLPSVPGFDIAIDGSLLILTKDCDRENVKVSVDVINSLGREDSFNEDGEVDEDSEPIFVARPHFQVDLQRDELTLVFRCSFVENIYEGQEDEFRIEHFFVHDGSTNPTQYVALGRQTNPELYDRFMGLIEERGIDGEFAKRLQELATAHEHRCYIRTLKGMTEFLSS